MAAVANKLETILGGVRELQAQGRAKGRAAYAALVSRLAADKPKKGDTPASVGDLLAELDLGPDDLERDLGLAQRRIELRKVVARLPQLERDRDEAFAAFQRIRLRREETIRRLEQEEREADAGKKAARSALSAAYKARDELRRSAPSGVVGKLEEARSRLGSLEAEQRSAESDLRRDANHLRAFGESREEPAKETLEHQQWTRTRQALEGRIEEAESTLARCEREIPQARAEVVRLEAEAEQV